MVSGRLSLANERVWLLLFGLLGSEVRRGGPAFLILLELLLVRTLYSEKALSSQEVIVNEIVPFILILFGDH